MAEQSESVFDFDDWAGLYIENPQEFEARRKAILMIAMTQGSAEHCAAGKALLASYEKRVEGADAQQRMQVSASMLIDSLQQLQAELMMFKHALEEIENSPEP